MTPAFFDLSGRVRLRVKGADSFRYLNGQITNDLRKATPAAAIQASILTAKGKLSGHVFVTAEDGGGFLLDADAEQRETLPARLERYVIADDVEIEDVSSDFPVFHLIGAAVPAGLETAKTVAANRFGHPGHDLWIAPETADEARQKLSAVATFIDASSAELLRIESGIPRWGAELTDEIIPVEANLEDAAIDYSKGCYIGQEVISRMKMSGQTNKRLRGLISSSGGTLVPGMRLWSPDEPPKEVGWISSAARSERVGKQIALGYVKRGFNEEESQLVARLEPEAEPTRVTIVPLPFI